MKLKDVKNNLNCRVHWNDAAGYGSADYIFTACTIRRNNNGFFYEAELQHEVEVPDFYRGKHVIICKLEDIELIP